VRLRADTVEQLPPLPTASAVFELTFFPRFCRQSCGFKFDRGAFQPRPYVCSPAQMEASVIPIQLAWERSK
jgi:hypothetical protein